MASETSRWDRSAESYATSSWHSNEAALAHLVSAASPKGGIWLDIATGAGHAAFALAPYVDLVVAVDSSASMLRVAGRSGNEKGLINIELVRADAHYLPFCLGMFDGIVCRCACHHLHDLDAFLLRAKELLSRNGVLVIVDTVGSEDEDTDFRLDQLERLRDPTHVRDYTPTEWRKRAKAAGYRIEYEDEISKPLNAEQWMDRQAVPSVDRSKILDIITNSTGWFREYLRPHGDGKMLTFHLAEMTLRLRV